MFMHLKSRINKLNRAIDKLESVELFDEADVLREELVLTSSIYSTYIKNSLTNIAVILILSFTLITAIGCSSTTIVDEYSCVESLEMVDKEMQNVCSENRVWEVRDISDSNTKDSWSYQEWTRN